MVKDSRKAEALLLATGEHILPVGDSIPAAFSLHNVQ